MYRILAVKGPVHQQPVTPRVRRRAGQPGGPQPRSVGTDITHIFCGRHGWVPLVVVLDCRDRECIGWEFARRGRVKEAERALEEVCLARFGRCGHRANPGRPERLRADLPESAFPVRL